MRAGLVTLLLAVLVGGEARADDSAAAAQAMITPPFHGTLSCGSANRGALSFAREMPIKGSDWIMPETWAKRGHNYGTDELVGVIQRAARKVADQYPGSVLGVADLSKQTGGAVAGHRSHQSGRDADLLYYAVDADGAPFPPDSVMPVYTRSGKAYYAKAPSWQPRIPVRYFDLARNWALVKALITDERTTVTNIFVARRIRFWLIRYAREIGEPKDLIAKAARTVVVPRNVQSHVDHMHIRVACGADDVEAGRCKDHLAPRRRGNRKWYRQVRCPSWIR